MASAYVAVRGMEMSAPSMANMPSVTIQRWKKRFLTKSNCHRFSCDAT